MRGREGQAVVLAALTVVACGGRTGSPADAGRVEAGATDAYAGFDFDACPASSPDASPENASNDAGDGGCSVGGASGIVCDESFASYCCSPHPPYEVLGACTSTWQSIHAKPPCYPQALPVGSCPGYQFLGFPSADTAIILVYDSQTGQQVAVLGSSPGGIACAAGPACLPLDLDACTVTSLTAGCGDGG